MGYSDCPTMPHHVDFKAWYHCQAIRVRPRTASAIAKENRCQGPGSARTLQFFCQARRSSCRFFSNQTRFSQSFCCRIKAFWIYKSSFCLSRQFFKLCDYRSSVWSNSSISRIRNRRKWWTNLICQSRFEFQIRSTLYFDSFQVLYRLKKAQFNLKTFQFRRQLSKNFRWFSCRQFHSFWTSRHFLHHISLSMQWFLASRRQLLVEFNSFCLVSQFWFFASLITSI